MKIWIILLLLPALYGCSIYKKTDVMIVGDDLITPYGKGNGKITIKRVFILGENLGDINDKTRCD